MTKPDAFNTIHKITQRSSPTPDPNPEETHTAMLGRAVSSTGAAVAAAAAAATRTTTRAGAVRCLSAPPQSPPPPPSPEELQKMVAVAEDNVGRIREGTYHTGEWVPL